MQLYPLLSYGDKSGRVYYCSTTTTPDCLLTRTHVVYPAAWLNRAVATTNDQLGGDLRGQLPSSTGTRCFSSILEGDVMYVLGKTVDLSFEGCPEPPVAAAMCVGAVQLDHP
jgi:hypothetical protein